MKINLYLKLEGYNDGDFDVSNDYYKSDEEYFDAVNREVKQYSNVAYDAIANLGNISKKRDANFQQSTRVGKNAIENNYKTEAVLIDENGNDETVDSLITKCVNQDVVINIIKFNRDTMDEEFEEDYKFWIEEHNSISKYKDELGDDKVWENEPSRTFYGEFINNAGETKYVRFENCKILDEGDVDELAILSEKITLVDRI